MTIFYFFSLAFCILHAHIVSLSVPSRHTETNQCPTHYDMIPACMSEHTLRLLSSYPLLRTYITTRPIQSPNRCTTHPQGWINYSTTTPTPHLIRNPTITRTPTTTSVPFEAWPPPCISLGLLLTSILPRILLCRYQYLCVGYEINHSSSGWGDHMATLDRRLQTLTLQDRIGTSRR